jgi:hypothetical protein
VVGLREIPLFRKITLVFSMPLMVQPMRDIFHFQKQELITENILLASSQIL